MQALCRSIGPFDVVIDDGSHQAPHIISAFKTLFPCMKKGSLYVVEDLHTQYNHKWGGYGNETNPRSGPRTAIRFLKGLVDDINYIAATTASAGDNRNIPDEIAAKRSRYSKRIDSISFYPAIAFIQFK